MGIHSAFPEILVKFAIVYCSVGGSVVASPIISIQPASKSVALGNSVFLNINISGVTDLYAFQFDLGFAPGILSGIGTTEGPLLPTGGGTFFIPGAVDNVGGTIMFTADTLLTAILGVNGSGTLATVQFTAIGLGSSAVTLSNVMLLDSNLSPIADITTDGNVIVQGSTTPEPGTWLLASISAIMLVLRRRLKTTLGLVLLLLVCQ